LGGAGLLGFNYLFLMYSRVANRVMPPLFFTLLGIFFLQKKNRKPWCFFAAGTSFFLAFASKSVVFYVLASVYAGYLLYALFHQQFKETAKQTGFLAAGTLIPGLPWFFFLYLPHQDFIRLFTQLNVRWLIPPANISLILKYFWTRPTILLENMFLLCVLAALASLLLLHKAVTNQKNVFLVDFMFLFWFFTGYIYYAVIQQRVTRHVIPQVVPIVFLAVFLAHHWFERPYGEKKRPGWMLGLFLFLWLLFPVSLALKNLSSRYPQLFAGQNSLNITLLIASLLLAMIGLGLLKMLAKFRRDLVPSQGKKSVMIFCLAAVLIFQGIKYFDWALSPQFQFRNISRDLGKAFSQATIAGLWAPVICLENTHRAHEYFPGVINDHKDFFQRFGITHVFTTTAFGENQKFERNFPDVMRDAELLALYHIWTVKALLYDVRTISKKKDKHYEAELYTHRGSTPRFDPQASQKFAVRSHSRKGQFVVVIPAVETFLQGRHKITFRMKAEKNIQDPKKRIARLDVISAERRRVLAYKDLFRKDFNTNGYQDIPLTFRVRKPQKIKFRVYTQGNGTFWIDNVHTIRIP
jgi:hypothetical protein